MVQRASRHPPPGDDGPVGLAPLPARTILTQFFNQGVMIVLENKNQNQEWSYTGKEIAEMFLGMKQDIADLRVEMRETKMLIRDYNSFAND